MIDLGDDNLILAAMATCHSLTVIDSKLVGDPLDIRMFEGTGPIGKAGGCFQFKSQSAVHN